MSEVTRLGSHTVLCIEDNPDNLKLIEHIFISLLGGIRLLSASNAEEGVQLAAKQLPDLILMDIDLPGMDGYEALKVLRNEDKTAVIPVLAISAHAHPDQVARGHEAGFVDYLTKPFNLHKLKKAIQLQLDVTSN